MFLTQTIHQLLNKTILILYTRTDQYQDYTVRIHQIQLVQTTVYIHHIPSVSASIVDIRAVSWGVVCYG